LNHVSDAARQISDICWTAFRTSASGEKSDLQIIELLWLNPMGSIGSPLHDNLLAVAAIEREADMHLLTIAVEDLCCGRAVASCSTTSKGVRDTFGRRGGVDMLLAR
jgi:hypothetical protein